MSRVIRLIFNYYMLWNEKMNSVRFLKILEISEISADQTHPPITRTQTHAKAAASQPAANPIFQIQ